MTRDEFEAFVEDGHHMVVVRPYAIVPCSCGDMNCRGWKLRPDVAAPPPPKFGYVAAIDQHRRLR